MGLFGKSEIPSDVERTEQKKELKKKEKKVVEKIPELTRFQKIFFAASQICAIAVCWFTYSWMDGAGYLEELGQDDDAIFGFHYACMIFALVLMNLAVIVFFRAPCQCAGSKTYFGVMFWSFASAVTGAIMMYDHKENIGFDDHYESPHSKVGLMLFAGFIGLIGSHLLSAVLFRNKIFLREWLAQALFYGWAAGCISGFVNTGQCTYSFGGAASDDICSDQNNAVISIVMMVICTSLTLHQVIN